MTQNTETSTLISDAQAGVLLTTAGRVITAANTAAHTMLGFGSSGLLGRQVRTLYAADDDYSAVNAAIQNTGPTGADSRTRVTLRDASGAFFDANVVVLPVRDAHGKITSLVEIIARADADPDSVMPDTNRDHGDMLRFARGAAHDFKNLLAIITGNLGLAKDAKTTSLNHRFIEDAERAAKDAVRIADQMIAFARHQHIAPEIINVADVITQLMPMWRFSARKEVPLTSTVSANLPPVFVDRSGLSNALLNLVLNARDAITDSGEITISALIVEGAFGANANPRTFVAIAVRDTGFGMTEHIRSRAFDPFFSTKPASHGRGLGLSTVLGFARQANGHVTIESELGVGTTVTLLLPPA